jgi:hypothetical protein
MDGSAREIRSELRRIQCSRLRLDKERQRLLDEKFDPPVDQIVWQAWRLRLENIERNRTRLDHQEADVRRREHGLSVQLGSTPSSSSRSDFLFFSASAAFPKQHFFRQKVPTFLMGDTNATGLFLCCTV